jgi:tetratricopeptide (TPR) repeat protein
VISLPRGAYVPVFSAAVSKLNVPPAAAATASDAHPVGRESELDLLRSAFAAAAGGNSQIITITGEAGIGKTKLIEGFLAELEHARTSCWVLRGRCSERLSETEPFVPVFECLEGILQNKDRTECRRILQAAAPAWLACLDPAAAALEQSHSAERFRREFGRFLRSLSEHRPVVLFWDDLHWVDESTVDLLAWLSSHVRDFRALILTAYRPSAVLSAHPFVSLKLSLERRGECREISLRGLSRADVEAYVKAAFPGNLFPPAFFSAVHERTEGHPLFIRDILRFLTDREIVAPFEDWWRPDGEISGIRSLIPPGAQNMIRLEISQMAADDQRILECAAVQGVNFDAAVVSKVLELDPADVENRLGRLALSRQFVESCGDVGALPPHASSRFRFAHVLYQNALYADIVPTRRVTLSLAVAAALIDDGAEAAFGGAAEIAILLESGRDHERSSQYFGIAARQAISLFAYPEAVILCRRGLKQLFVLAESLQRDASELEFSLILGLALMVTRGYAAPEVENVHRRARELCLRLHDTKRIVRVLWGIHTCLVNAAEFDASLEVAEEMQRIAISRGDADGHVQSLHALGTTLCFMGRVSEGRHALERALEILALSEERTRRSVYILDTQVACLSMLARALTRMDLPDEALATASASLDRASKLDHPPTLAYAIFWVGWAHHARQEYARACGPLETTMEMSRKYGLPLFLEWGRVLHGSCLAHLGNLTEGVAEIRLSLENQLSMRCMLERPFALTILAEALLLSGERDEAVKVCDEALEIARSTAGKSFVTETNRLRGRALSAPFGSC